MTKKKTGERDRQLVLRCCGPKGESHNGFAWPLTVGAEVSAPDWEPTQTCGYGLHGWLHGAGDHECSNYAMEPDAQWLVLSVESADIIMLGGKCKFPRCRVEFVGRRHEASAYIREHSAQARECAVIGAVVAVGDDEIAVVGALGTATAGDSGTATAAVRGTATAGALGTATAGVRGTATAGDRGTATAGALGTATAGVRGTATAGDRGTATAGALGTATAGDSGTATAADSGTATAGDGGTIVIEWYDRKAKRYRRTVGYVGENGIEANVAYRCTEDGTLVRAETSK